VYARASFDTMAMDIRQSHISLVNLDFFSLPATHFWPNICSTLSAAGKPGRFKEDPHSALALTSLLRL
jgi:hypothetical protein